MSRKNIFTGSNEEGDMKQLLDKCKDRLNNGDLDNLVKQIRDLQNRYEAMNIEPPKEIRCMLDWLLSQEARQLFSMVS